jgi:hypothetical protein
LVKVREGRGGEEEGKRRGRGEEEEEEEGRRGTEIRW